MYSKVCGKNENVVYLKNGEICSKASSKGLRLILRGGLVIDPKNNVKSEKDIAIVDDHIVLVEDKIYPEEQDLLIDCEGLQVWPGLIDMHLHIGDLFEMSTKSAFHAVEDGVTTGLSPGAGNTFMAPALLGAEMDRGMPLNTGVYLGAANVLGTSLNVDELIQLFKGNLSEEIAMEKMTRNPITNQTAPLIMGIKDHMGHFIMSDEHIEMIFQITSKAELIYMSHTQDPSHTYRLAEASKGRRFHLGHASAVGCGTHCEPVKGIEEVINLCKNQHITGEFVTTMLRDSLGCREGLKINKYARDKALEALSEQTINILVSDGQNQSTMKGFGDTRDNIPCLLELVDNRILTLEQAVATMTCNPSELIGKITNNSVWKEKMGHLAVGAFANITIVNPKNKLATYVIVNGKLVSFENRILRSYGQAGRWVSKFGVTNSLGVGQLSIYN